MAQRATRVPVWLDCDPGHDDAMAIVLAGWSSQVRVLGISTVAGNHTVTRTTANALSICNAAGLGYVPVVAGAAQPILRPAQHCPEIHGESGMDCFGGLQLPSLPADKRAVDAKAVNYIAAAIHGARAQHKDKVTIIATGALTNIALLLSVYPELKDDISQIVIMGGAVGRGPAAASGNTGVAAEFNIQIDPEAAAMVFQSGVEITMVPLDVTHTALVTSDILDRVAHGSSGSGSLNESAAVIGQADLTSAPASSGSGADAALITRAATPFRQLLVSLLEFFSATYRDVFGFVNGPPLHDPCAVAYVINPGLFTTMKRHVDIELVSTLAAGQTIVDWHGITKQPGNCNVCVGMDVAGFWELMLHSIGQADAHSSMNGPEDLKVAKQLLGSSLLAAASALSPAKSPSASLSSPVRRQLASADFFVSSPGTGAHGAASTGVPASPAASSHTVPASTSTSTSKPVLASRSDSPYSFGTPIQVATE